MPDAHEWSTAHVPASRSRTSSFSPPHRATAANVSGSCSRNHMSFGSGAIGCAGVPVRPWRSGCSRAQALGLVGRARVGPGHDRRDRAPVAVDADERVHRRADRHARDLGAAVAGGGGRVAQDAQRGVDDLPRVLLGAAGLGLVQRVARAGVAERRAVRRERHGLRAGRPDVEAEDDLGGGAHAESIPHGAPGCGVPDPHPEPVPTRVMRRIAPLVATLIAACAVATAHASAQAPPATPPASRSSSDRPRGVAGSPCAGREQVHLSGDTALRAAAPAVAGPGEALNGMAQPQTCEVWLSSTMDPRSFCTVLVHELGHLAGRGHTATPGDVMNGAGDLDYAPCDRVTDAPAEQVEEELRSVLPAPRAAWRITCGPRAPATAAASPAAAAACAGTTSPRRDRRSPSRATTDRAQSLSQANW